eukprot:11223066-Lingulodinium_polyedra.AAC.1
MHERGGASGIIGGSASQGRGSDAQFGGCVALARPRSGRGRCWVASVCQPMARAPQFPLATRSCGTRGPRFACLQT